MISRESLQSHVRVLVAYAALAVVLAWPLPLHMATHLTGGVGGDTGVYVWNQWVFQREILEQRSLPYFTDRIFALAGGANLSLHNYTIFQNLLALPLIGLFGVVTTFNVIFLAMTVLTAYATFLLARHVTGRVEESWLAGLLFAWCPIFVTRGMGHFSLVAAAPLAVFLLFLLRTAERQRLRDAVALGAAAWWAASTDAYYAVYCLTIAVLFIAVRVILVERTDDGRRAVRRVLDTLILCAAGLVAALLLGGGWEFTIGGRQARIVGLYTPVLVLTALLLLRAALHYRGTFADVTRADAWRLARLAATAGIVSTALLAPVLYAAARRMADDSHLPPVLWRSSVPGADLLAFVLPNPNHPLAPAAISRWLNFLPNGYLENVVSIPLVALATLLVAWRAGWKPARWWMGLTIAFGLLALGPFVRIAEINTHVPGPWALLRYMPLIGLARSPSRFAVVMMLALAVLFAMALCWLGRRYPQRRRLILLVVGALLVVELLPVPRTLYSAGVPQIYVHIAEAPADVRVLELPFGFRDGAFSVGNFTARSQFHQTFHGKPLIGGYLSRAPWTRLGELRDNEVVDGLIVLSEGDRLPPDREARFIAAGPAFVEAARVGFVSVDRSRTPELLLDLAIRAFRLQLIGSDREIELYRPERGGFP